MTSIEKFNGLYIAAHNKEITFDEFLKQLNKLVEFRPIGENIVDNISTYNWGNQEDRDNLTIATNNQDLVLKLIKEHGGYEGSGEDYFIIYYVIPYDRYIQQIGNYYSYDGIVISDSLFEVVPQKVEVIEYVSV